VKKETDDGAPRITQQFRSRGAMVYDLRGSTGRLTLRISGTEDDGAAPVWRIEASTSHSSEAEIVSASASTRADALRAVGSAWTERRASLDLPVFDWEAVARALAGVRAL
jgi:hypothetical protein